MEGRYGRWLSYLLEAQDVVCLFQISGNNTGLTEPLGKSSALPQCPVLNGSGKEGRGIDLFPQVKTG
jgi:hypothetical protein